jgi:glycosyltransferase involved in cell wall biosynthesis
MSTELLLDKKLSKKNFTHPTSNIRLLQVLPSLRSGGVERGTIDIAAAAANRGCESYVVSAGGPLTSKLNQYGVTHFTLNLESKNPLNIYKNSFNLRKLIEENNINILHARSRAPAWSALLAAKKTGCKFVTTFHGRYNFKNKYKLWYNSVMARGDHVIAVSNFIAEHIKENYKVNEEKLTVIHRGVDLEYFNPEKINQVRIIQAAQKLPISFERPIVLMPGRLTRWKGQAVLLKAISLLPKNSVSCILIGDDKGHQKYRRELENLVEKLSLEEDVLILPHSNDIAALYMLSDVVISASTEPEAFGRVVTEGQAMGRMVIASNIGGARETIINNQTGWLVEPDNHEELAEAIRKAISLNEEERMIFSKRARKHIEDNFSLELMCDKTFNVYEKMLK